MNCNVLGTPRFFKRNHKGVRSQARGSVENIWFNGTVVMICM